MFKKITSPSQEETMARAVYAYKCKLMYRMNGTQSYMWDELTGPQKQMLIDAVQYGTVSDIHFPKPIPKL